MVLLDVWAVPAECDLFFECGEVTLEKINLKVFRKTAEKRPCLKNYLINFAELSSMIYELGLEYTCIKLIIAEEIVCINLIKFDLFPSRYVPIIWNV